MEKLLTNWLLAKSTMALELQEDRTSKRGEHGR